eukprot:699950-Pyramimonas_sp.AAC.1
MKRESLGRACLAKPSRAWQGLARVNNAKEGEQDEQALPKASRASAYDYRAGIGRAQQVLAEHSSGGLAVFARASPNSAELSMAQQGLPCHG